MSDWQVGDLALCVRGGPITLDAHYPSCRYPEAGKVYEVGGIDWDESEKAFWITALGAPDNVDRDGNSWGPMWFECRFVKITPPAADEFDRETIALLNGVEQPA